MGAGGAKRKGKYGLHSSHDHEPSSEQNGANYQSNNSNTAIRAEEVAEQKHAIAEQNSKHAVAEQKRTLFCIGGVLYFEGIYCLLGTALRSTPRDNDNSHRVCGVVV